MHLQQRKQPVRGAARAAALTHSLAHLEATGTTARQPGHVRTAGWNEGAQHGQQVARPLAPHRLDTGK